VLVAQGNLTAALQAYRDSLAIAERLAKADPRHAGWQRDLSVSYYKVGNVLETQGKLGDALNAYRDSLAIFERLAKADPGNAGWQRDLSVSYHRVGDVLVAQGNLTEALQAYRDSLGIRARLASTVTVRTRSCSSAGLRRRGRSILRIAAPRTCWARNLGRQL
jgi:tetratricopeptide (TPR) repeat protein